MRARLLVKLVSAYLLPTAALAVGAPLVGWVLARRGLEEEVGRRLVAAAGVAAGSIKADLLLTLQPGDEGNRTHRNLVARLDSLKTGTGVERLYAFDRARRLLVATGEAPPIGTFLPALERDRLEVERAFAGSANPSAVTFRGTDGRTYLSGYAPVLDAAGAPVAAVGADASAEFFDVLTRLGTSMALLAGAIGALGLLLFYLAGSRWILRPVGLLHAAAERIGAGDLASPVPSLRRDELGELAATMESMRSRLAGREREMQTMLAGIAHEVRNPLGGIELFSGFLAEELAGEPDRLAHVLKVQRELAHLKRVVDDFLDFAREPRLNRQALDSNVLLDEVADVLRADASKKGLSLEVVGEPVRLVADSAALRRALLNLARNAIQAAPEGGHVRMGARRAGDRVELLVSDDGPGVPPADRSRLFTPFFTTKEKGLGLGLALARRIAEAHGGGARLDHESPGATFVLDLPAS